MASSQDDEYLDTYVSNIIGNVNHRMNLQMSKVRNGCMKHGGNPEDGPKLKVRFKDIDEDVDEKSSSVETDYVVVESFGVPNMADFESSPEGYQYEPNYNDYEYSTRIATSIEVTHLQASQDRTTNQETDYNAPCRNNENISDTNANHRGVRDGDVDNLNITGDGETLVASSSTGSRVCNSSMAPRHFRYNNSNRNDMSPCPREECDLNNLDDPQRSADPRRGIPLNPYLYTDEDSYSQASTDSEEGRGLMYVIDDSADQTEEEFIRLEQQIEQLYYYENASKNKSSDKRDQMNNMDSRETLRLHTTEIQGEECMQKKQTAQCIRAGNDQVSQPPEVGAMSAKHASPSRRTRDDQIDSLEQKSAQLAVNFRKILQYEIAREATGSDVNELQDAICELRIKISQERKEKEAMMEFFIEKERESASIQRHLYEEIGTLHSDLTRTIESKIEEDVYQQSRLARELMRARADHDRYLVATLERQNKINELAIAVKSQQVYIQTLEETTERMRSTLKERNRNSAPERPDLKGISPTEGASASNNLLDVLHCEKGRFMGGVWADGTLCALQLFGISDITEENEDFEVFGAMDPLNLPYIRQQLRACAELQEEVSQESC